MKRYRGITFGGPVMVYTDDGNFHELPHRVLHSPTGFAWGYGGSGPAELARCILWDHTGDEPSSAMYQQFKESCIATRSQDERFELKEDELEEWLTAWKVCSGGN